MQGMGKSFLTGRLLTNEESQELAQQQIVDEEAASQPSIWESDIIEAFSKTEADRECHKKDYPGLEMLRERKAEKKLLTLSIFTGWAIAGAIQLLPVHLSRWKSEQQMCIQNKGSSDQHNTSSAALLAGVYFSSLGIDTKISHCGGMFDFVKFHKVNNDI